MTCSPRRAGAGGYAVASDGQANDGPQWARRQASPTQLLVRHWLLAGCAAPFPDSQPSLPGPLQIVERDVPARYLLRLGMGEAELETELDFRWGTAEQ